MAEPDSDLARGRELMKSGATPTSPVDAAKKNMGVEVPKQEKYPEGTVISDGGNPPRRMVRQGGKWVPVK